MATITPQPTQRQAPEQHSRSAAVGTAATIVLMPLIYIAAIVCGASAIAAVIFGGAAVTVALYAIILLVSPAALMAIVVIGSALAGTKGS